MDTLELAREIATQLLEKGELTPETHDTLSKASLENLDQIASLLLMESFYSRQSAFDLIRDFKQTYCPASPFQSGAESRLPLLANLGLLEQVRLELGKEIGLRKLQLALKRAILGNYPDVVALLATKTSRILDLLEDCSEQMVEVLLKARNVTPQQVLESAARQGHLAAIRQMRNLHPGLQVDKALRLAAIEARLEAVEYLLPDASAEARIVALSSASSRGCEEIVSRLLEVTPPSAESLCWAAINNEPEVVELLLNRSKEDLPVWVALAQAAREGHLGVMGSILKSCPVKDLNQLEMPLMAAIRGGAIEPVLLLLHRGAVASPYIMDTLQAHPNPKMEELLQAWIRVQS